MVLAALAFAALVLVRGDRARTPGAPRSLSRYSVQRGVQRRLLFRRREFFPGLPSFASFRWRFCRRGGIPALPSLILFRGGVVPSGGQLAGIFRSLPCRAVPRFLRLLRALPDGLGPSRCGGPRRWCRGLSRGGRG